MVDAETTLPTCYRHPDRSTRLACSSCERPVCVDCVQPAAVGQKCPDCARGDQPVRPIRVVQPRGESSPVAFTLLGVNLLAFLLVASGSAPSFLQPQVNGVVAAGGWPVIFSAAFLHADITHLLFNMWALYVFGPQLERVSGSAPFAGLYLASAAAGGVAFFLLGDPGGVAVGASGAIFGLFGAYLALAYRARRTPAGAAGLRQLLLLLAINLALPLLVPRIAWQAHLGGLLAGALIAVLWALLRARRLGSSVARTAAAAAVGLAALLPVLA
jgi:membrane associated rhomboid family serine protease